MLITLNPDSDVAIYQQLADAIKKQIAAGTIKHGDELPPVRTIAESLGINLHTVRHAYQLLADQGLVSMNLGRRTRVRQINDPALTEQTEAALVKYWQQLKQEAILRGLRSDQFNTFVQLMLNKLENNYDTPNSP